jgi:hypothetical protein
MDEGSQEEQTAGFFVRFSLVSAARLDCAEDRWWDLGGRYPGSPELGQGGADRERAHSSRVVLDRGPALGAARAVQMQ